MLNTPLSAWQVIPSGHITVTSPVVPTGVTGDMQSGTISTTTITPPAGATRQAVTKIKAAVLSTTNNMPYLTAQNSCLDPISTMSQNKPSEKAYLAENQSSKPRSTSATPSSATINFTEFVAQTGFVHITHSQFPFRGTIPALASALDQTVFIFQFSQQCSSDTK